MSADDSEEYISPTEFMERLQAIDEAIAPLLPEIGQVIVALERRLDDIDAHQCPQDHQVHESMVQSKCRMAEALMWLRSAVATKIAAEEEDQEDLPPFHHGGENQPN